MQHKPNTVRIIAGKYRRRILSFPTAPGLRPTHDRIRETLFNWLQSDIVGSTCLDLFAGSGAFGFEAISRGARHVTMIDSCAAAITALKNNRKILGADEAQIIQAKTPDINLGLLCKHYDIVFLDPPFASDLLEPTLNFLVHNHLLHADSVVYIEQPKEKTQIPTGFEVIREGHTKQIGYALVSLAS